ncbi:facilitated trehalose transporter Tret1-like [Ceratina calcarata]|uniref:Facilitated trehalose transporter Tret1-like n=1 Tax=Ceratina calcarata TaxID=156304 RepID=A0AAJ7S7G8_9HYME|nr:facilitated trehalose transporter Tret1-like [Ceratina calcarata]
MTSYGAFFGWSSPSLPLLLQEDSPIRMTKDQATWVSSVFLLGGAMGALICSYIVNILGRKRVLLFTVIPALLGWMIIAFATSVWQLIIGRFICGISNGHGYVSAHMYIGEISPANIRGILTSALTVASKFGLFTEWVVGPFLSVRDLALVSCTLPILFFAALIWFPESPYHLMRHGKHDEAVTVLVQLRGTVDVSKEVDTIEKYIKIDLANNNGLWELLSVSGNRKALLVVLGLLVVQQWSGSLAILSYAELIFNSANSEFEGKYVTMIVGGVQVICAVMSATLGDRFERRTLLMISAFGVSVSTFLVGLFFFLRNVQENVDNITWLPAVALLLYIIVYAIGLAAIPFTMMSEVFPTNVKAMGSMIGMLCTNLCAFIVALTYQSIASHGEYVAFWLFSAVGIAGVLFIYCYVPETRGKTLQEIQDQLHGYKL